MKTSSLKLLAGLSLTALTAGCTSPYKENFNCPIGQGYACKSLSHVHEQIQQGAFHESPDDTNIYLPPQLEGN